MGGDAAPDSQLGDALGPRIGRLLPAGAGQAGRAAQFAQGRRLSRAEVRSFAIGCAGVAALMLWAQMAATPFIYPQVQALYYPSSIVLCASLAAMACVRRIAGRFPLRAVAAAGVLVAVACAARVLFELGSAASFACLLVECLGLGLLAGSWMDSALQGEGGASALSLVAGAFVASSACFLLQAAGVMDALPWRPGGVQLAGAAAGPGGSAGSGGGALAGGVLVVGLPVLSAGLLIVQGGGASGRRPDAANREFAAATAVTPATAAPTSAAPASESFPWPLLAVLVGAGVVCSVFVGLNTNPFIINSRTLGADVMAASALSCLAALALLWLHPRVPLVVIYAAAAACACLGFAMYGAGLGGNLVRALSFVCAGGFFMRLLLMLAFVRHGVALGDRAVPLFLLLAAVSLSAVGEQLGLWAASSWGLGVGQVEVFGFGSLVAMAAATVALVIAKAQHGKREADRTAKDALAAEAAAVTMSERARRAMEEAQARVAEKSRAAEEAAIAAERAAAIAERAVRAAEEARRAEREARQAEEQAKVQAREAVAAASAIDVPFEMSAEEDGLLARYFQEGGLSSREADVMKLVAKRYPNKVVAEKLFISERTVKFHVTNSYQKLGLKSRAELVLAVEQYLSDHAADRARG